MTNKPIIKETIVVEGKTDADKILSLFQANIITTNGSDCNKQTISMIKQANLKNGVILFLDPDYMGEKIRKMITNQVPNLKQAFIKVQDVINNKHHKIGIAEAADEAIKKALINTVTFDTSRQTLSLSEYNLLELNTKQKRLIVCHHYKISYCNNKQLWRRLNMIGVTLQDLMSWFKYEN